MDDLKVGDFVKYKTDLYRGVGNPGMIPHLRGWITKIGEPEYNGKIHVEINWKTKVADRNQLPKSVCIEILERTER